MKKDIDEKTRKKIGDAYSSAYSFAMDVYESIPGIIKSVVLFGSVEKQTMGPKSDIDVLVIVDDTTVAPGRKFIEWYNTEMLQILRRNDPRLHLTTITLTTFWENVRVGEPLIINVLRNGVSLIDTGLFEPIQILLQKGRIRPSKEAIHNALTRAPWHLVRANGRVLAAVVDFYWTVVDSAHAALMSYGEVPPSPEHVEPLLNKAFVSKKMLKKSFLNYYKEIREAAKAVMHGEMIRLSGIDYDRYRLMAQDFEGMMKKLVDQAEKDK